MVVVVVDGLMAPQWICLRRRQKNSGTKSMQRIGKTWREDTIARRLKLGNLASMLLCVGRKKKGSWTGDERAGRDPTAQTAGPRSFKGPAGGFAAPRALHAMLVNLPLRWIAWILGSEDQWREVEGSVECSRGGGDLVGAEPEFEERSAGFQVGIAGYILGPWWW